MTAPHLLFCFPYAGGSAFSIYHKWKESMPGDIQVVPVELSGHQRRLTSPLFETIQEIAADILVTLDKLIHHPYSFFGHSMGGWIIHELCMQLLHSGKPLPQQLVISAMEPPHLGVLDFISDLDDPAFIKKVYESNGIPDEVMANADMLKFVLPILKSDYKAIESYQPVQYGYGLRVPVYTLSAESDTVPQTVIEQWRKYTIVEYENFSFEGDHFFINSSAQSVVRCVKSLLKK